jgi:hypothetical protein
MNEIKTYLYKKDKNKMIKIYQDSDYDDPRNWTNCGKMFCMHKRYDLPNETDMRATQYDSWEAYEKEIETKYKAKIILPLYMYDHSGITISTKPFNDMWDSGQIGFIFITEESIEKNKLNLKEAKERLLYEVKIYDDYLTGQVYGYSMINLETCDKCNHTEEKIIDSCWGIYLDKDLDTEIFEHIGENIDDYEEKK